MATHRAGMFAALATTLMLSGSPLGVAAQPVEQTTPGSALELRSRTPATGMSPGEAIEWATGSSASAVVLANSPIVSLYDELLVNEGGKLAFAAATGPVELVAREVPGRKVLLLWSRSNGRDTEVLAGTSPAIESSQRITGWATTDGRFLLRASNLRAGRISFLVVELTLQKQVPRVALSWDGIESGHTSAAPEWAHARAWLDMEQRAALAARSSIETETRLDQERALTSQNEKALSSVCSAVGRFASVMRAAALRESSGDAELADPTWAGRAYIYAEIKELLAVARRVVGHGITDEHYPFEKGNRSPTCEAWEHFLTYYGRVLHADQEPALAGLGSPVLAQVEATLQRGLGEGVAVVPYTNTAFKNGVAIVSDRCPNTANDGAAFLATTLKGYQRRLVAGGLVWAVCVRPKDSLRTAIVPLL